MNVPHFDTELGLTQLLGGLPPTHLEALLGALLVAPVRLLETEPPVDGDNRVPLQWELETLAWLVSPADEQRLQAAVRLIEHLFQSNARYHMAAALHQETVQADFDKLQQQHTALQHSEARYRALSEQLEQRVAEQVQTIEQSQRKLYQTEKLAAVGQLAAGVAHEINNPIGFVNSNLRSAGDYLGSLRAFATALSPASHKTWEAAGLDEILDDFGALLTESSDGVRRVADIVKDLRTAADIDHSGEQLADLNATLRAVCNIAASRIRERAELILDLDELPPSRCHSDQLGQACLHLLLNATEAVTPPGEIRLSTRHRNGKILLSVSDNGVGIPPEQLERVFDPFYTTREVGQGTGLGLTVCRDIAQAHDGHIEIHSEVGVSTTVTLYLPVRT